MYNSVNDHNVLLPAVSIPTVCCTTTPGSYHTGKSGLKQASLMASSFETMPAARTFYNRAKAITTSFQSIFCCAGATPVLSEGSRKIHNDPNRDLHDAICQSFMRFGLRKQKTATLLALVHAHLEESKLEEEEKSLPPVSRSGDVPPSNLSLPPVNPGPEKIPQAVSGLSALSDSASPNYTRETGSQTLQPGSEGTIGQDVKSNDLLDSSAPVKKTSAARLVKSNEGVSEVFPSIVHIEQLPQIAESWCFESELVVPGTQPSVLASNDDFEIARTIHDSSTCPSAPPAPHAPLAPSQIEAKSCSKLHDHVMVIPTMPHPDHPTEELLQNPLTNETQYVIHLTSRHDYGPVYSHRYFICPENLDDDWIELTLLQWFARGEPFRMKAEKWDIKCENDSRFFRITLRPNLDMRAIE